MMATGQPTATWRISPRSPIRRIEEAALRLVEKFSDPTNSNSDAETADEQQKTCDSPERCVTATTDADAVSVTIGETTRRLSAEEAAELRTALGAALTSERTLLRTETERRRDGSYVVRRRATDSDGHSKVFESFEAVRRLFAELPAEFTATDVGRSGLSGGRRHMLVRFFAEHPDFDCKLVSEQPLTGRKRSTDADVGEVSTPAD